MKVRGRWGRAVRPRHCYLARAPEAPSFRLSRYLAGTTESSAETWGGGERGEPRPASGFLTRRVGVLGCRPFAVPTALRSARPRPGAPRHHAWRAPLGAGPCSHPWGPEADPLVLPHPVCLCPQHALSRPESLNELKCREHRGTVAERQPQEEGKRSGAESRKGSG